MNLRRRSVALFLAFGAVAAIALGSGSPAPTSASTTAAQGAAVPRAVGTGTGAVQPCPSDYWPGPATDFSGFAGGLSHGTAFSESRLTALSKADCLWQNDKPESTYDWFRAVDGRFVPSEISASTTTQYTSLRIDPVGFNSVGPMANWGCAPRTSFSGGCEETWRPDVIYRPANAAGVFDGVWLNATNNPYFVLDYTGCGGSDTVKTPLPCNVAVRFAQDTNGKVLLQKNIQVVVLIAVETTRTWFGNPNYEDSMAVPVSFMVRAGGELSITAVSTPRTVAYGKSANVTARVDGAVTGSAVALESGPTSGRGPWRLVGTATTDSAGQASFTIRPKATARYRVRLVDVTLGSTVSADAGVVTVSSTLGVDPGRVASGRVPIEVTVKPGDVTVTVQRKTPRGWVDKVSRKLPAAGVETIRVVVPRGRSTWRVVVPPRPDVLGVVSTAFTVVRR